jgi:hypothetical protein
MISTAESKAISSYCAVCFKTVIIKYLFTQGDQQTIYAEVGGNIRNTNRSEHVLECHICNLHFLSGRQMVQSLERNCYLER